MNRVASKLVQCPEKPPWSSAEAHLKREDEQMVKVSPMLQLIPHSISQSSVNFIGCSVWLLSVFLCTISSLLAGLFVSILSEKWHKISESTLIENYRISIISLTITR